MRWVEGGLVTLHLLPLVVELLSMPFTYALAWLDYDQRWYITTDRSLRIREGLWRVREVTLTFANIQQMTIRQGPVQRFFGIADLVVTTAGGGGGATSDPGQIAKEPVHTGVLRGVSNAEEIRDWILAKSRELKDSGLGDPDDALPRVPEELRGEDSGRPVPEVLEAARILKVESAALRAALVDRGSGGQETAGSNPGHRWQKM
jgi:membrane protein YdbS with pleckstrin-like domain